MNSARVFIAGLAVALLSGATSAGAQDQAQPILIYDYAVSHPVDDADGPWVPAIGASVPQAVAIATAEDRDDPYYGYIYHQGRPVIVDLTTRAVVRIGD